MRFLVIVVLFCFAVAGSAFLAKVGMRGSVETELESKSLSALAGAGFDGVNVEFDHLDASLSGKVDRPEDVGRVIALLKGTVPTAYWPTAEDSGISIRPTLPPRLRVVRQNGSDAARVEGILSDEEDAGRIMLGSRLHALTGIGKVDNTVTLDPMYLPFPKMAEFASLASGLLAHGAAEVSLADGVLNLSGTVPNDGLKAGLLDLANQIGAKSINDNIEVELPDTFTRVSELRITRNRFGITLNGVFPAGTDRASLLGVFREAAPNLGLTDRIELLDSCGPATWQESLAKLVPALLGGLHGEMTAELSANQIRLNGTSADEATRQGILDLLTPFRTAKPPFELFVDIAVAGAGGPGTRMELSAVYEGTLLILKGRLPDPSIVTEIEAKLKERLPDVSVKNEVTESGSLPADAWLAQLPEFFSEFLSRVSTGTFTFKDGMLDLEGRTIALSDRQILQNVAVNTVPSDYKVQNRLLHADQPFPKPDLLPEDRTKLAEALKPFPIYFDSGSEILKEEEKSKVAGIVGALKAVNAEVGLVVTGFSDNVGNAESNRELSLRRADSVGAELVRLGIPEASLSVDSVVEDVSELPRSQRWKSRRVEVSLKLDKAAPVSAPPVER